MIYNLTPEEVTQIKIALKDRAAKLRKDLQDVHTPEGFRIMGDILQDTINAQTKIKYYGVEPDSYYNDEY